MASRRQRLAQRRKTVGFSQEALADKLKVERSTVVRWERGESEPQPWFRPRIARVLRISVEQLDDLLTETTNDDTVAQAARQNDLGENEAASRHTPGPMPDESAVLEEVETSKRRQVITMAAAVAFGAALDQPAVQIIAEADERQIPTTVRAGDVRDLASTVDVLEALDHRAGGSAVRHQVLGALRWGVGLLEGSCTPAVRTDLAVTVARLADLAGWATFDAGLHAQARKLFLLGLRAAHESGDPGIRAHVATGLARQEISAGNPDTGLELVQLAQSARDALSPNAVSMLHTVQALAYARVPDSDRCWQAVHAATDTYRSELIDRDPPWIRYFSPAKLQGDTANALFDLLVAIAPYLGASQATKKAGRADLVARLTTAASRYPDSRARSKAIATTRLATLLYLEGDVEAASNAARSAIEVAGAVRSVRLGSDLRVMAQATGAAGKDGAAAAVRVSAHELAMTMA